MDPDALLASRPQLLRALDKLEGERRLIDFVRLMWPVLEPGRKLVRGWVLDAICEHLEAITRGEIRKLCINVPPGCSKSLLTSVFWPAWEWGPKALPSLRYIKASYAEHLTIRDNRKCMQLITHPLYRQFWNIELDPSQSAKTKFDNTNTGWMLATSVGGTGTGERGDRFIIDDPHSVQQSDSEARRTEALQWFTEVVPSRVNDPEKSVFLVIMQRVHEDDISGHILANDLGWEHLCVPMMYETDHPHPSKTTLQFKDPRTKDGELMWPERFSENYLKTDLIPNLSSWGGEYAVAGQLQQRPAPRGGGMFPTDKIHIITPQDVPRTGKVVRGWDLAGTTRKNSPWTVALKMRRTPDGNIYIEDIRRERATPDGVYRLIQSTAREDGFTVTQSLPQDPGQAGLAQKNHIAMLLEGFRFSITPESGAKEDRAVPFAAQAEAGKVYLVKAPWNEPFLAEARMFPAGKLKDQVDAGSRAYAKLIGKRNRHGSFSGGEVIDQ